MRHVERAVELVRTRRDAVVLLGIAPTSAETEYGWIEPAPTPAALGGEPVLRVRRFWEKPGEVLARHLLAHGCLWNSFVMVGWVSTFLALVEATTPRLSAALAPVRQALGTRLERAAAARAYAALPATNFSHHVLARARGPLLTIPVNGLEWTDIGNPQRVLAALARTGWRISAQSAGERATGHDVGREPTRLRVMPTRRSGRCRARLLSNQVIIIESDERGEVMRATRAVLAALAIVVVTAPAGGAGPVTLDERAAAIERASKAPDGERVVLGHISRKLQLPSEALRKQRAETKLGWGDILVANLVSRATRLTFDEVIAEFRRGKGWEELARVHHVDADQLANEMQHSQDLVEQRAEDRAPRSDHPSPTADRPSRGATPSTGHGHGH